MRKKIIDVCCGAKMFWFDKNNENVEFCDNRQIKRHEFYKNRYIEIKPDTVCDFRSLPFPDNAYNLVVFDPPHLIRAGDKSWIKLKYGKLPERWEDLIRDGFKECIRVCRPGGVIIFKWSEVQIPLGKILPLLSLKPLFGHRSGKNMGTHWVTFMKPEDTK